MKRCLTALAAVSVLTAGAMFASSAYAGNSFAISVGVPGLAVGYSNYGGYVTAYAPPPAVYAPAPAYYAPPVVYGGVVAYAPYRPWHPHAYYRPYYPYHRHW